MQAASRAPEARSLGQKVSHIADLKLGAVRLYIPAVTNRTTGKSMGEHTEITAKQWRIERQQQDRQALEGHQRAVAAWDRGFFDDLVIAVGDLRRDTIPCKDTSLEKLAKLPPAFDRSSGQGSLTAGNSSPLSDGASSIWVATQAGLAKLPPEVPRVKLIDWEIASIDFRVEGLLMAPAFAIPRDRVNPNGGSVALGHPFGATGARILSQAVKELAAMQRGARNRQHLCRRRPRQRCATGVRLSREDIRADAACCVLVDVV